MPAPDRLISRENLFFRPDTKLHRKRSNAAIKARERKRKPASLNSRTAPGEIIRRYGPDIVIVNDNGSGNMGKVEAFPAEKEIIQYQTIP